MGACSGFCKEAVNTKIGLISIPRQDLKGKDFQNIYPAKLSTEHGYLCPIGCKHNPKTEKATNALIAENGIASICHRNEWRG